MPKFAPQFHAAAWPILDAAAPGPEAEKLLLRVRSTLTKISQKGEILNFVATL
jgi:hypothetical protein